jgi:hypothetical protein
MKRTMPWLSDISFDLMVNFDSSPSEPNWFYAFYGTKFCPRESLPTNVWTIQMEIEPRWANSVQRFIPRDITVRFDLQSLAIDCVITTGAFLDCEATGSGQSELWKWRVNSSCVFNVHGKLIT